VEYVNKNEDIEITLQQISIDYREFESTMLDIRVKQELIVAPIHEYIENWLKLALIKITEDDQMEAIVTGHVLRFGYLGKWSPFAYESLSTKGETFTLVLCTLCLISL
jgi:hypothetical protein